MIFCVLSSDAEQEKKIAHDLQVKDLVNCYICPSCVFSHLEANEIDAEDKQELHYDLLSCVDKIITSGEISEEMKADIDFAKLIKMEIECLD
jgi:hypothetical protein